MCILRTTTEKTNSAASVGPKLCGMILVQSVGMHFSICWTM